MLNRWKSADPVMIIRNNRIDSCLLQHDFGNPNFVGIRGFSPREVAGMLSIPRIDTSREGWFVFHGDGFCHQHLLTALLNHIQKQVDYLIVLPKRFCDMKNYFWIF